MITEQGGKTAIVIGAGIVGLAAARSLAHRGYRVTVYERNARAVGASVRNFGMVWPVGQPAGEPYEMAMRSRAIWQEICTTAKVWHEPVGSLHLGYQDREMAVMEEYVQLYGGTRDCALLHPAQVLEKSPAANPDGLKGALWSATELIVDPREAIANVASYLEEQMGVEFKWNTAVHQVAGSKVFFGASGSQQADLVFVCSGADFETLYPEVFATAPITKCKLQMMRLVSQPDSWRIGPALCGGLSLLHYGAFVATPAASALRRWVETEMSDYLKWGIHVMVSQQGNGELTIGDSHEYGNCPDPFDREPINRLILDYLDQFTRFKDRRLSSSWNGVYAKMTNGTSYLLEHPDEQVWVLNALSGAGMTLSFGLAEKVLDEILNR